MANRSYIYGLKNGKHSSVGEYPYKIPYAFRILAAYDNKAGESDLFDKDVAIRADFERGRQALYKLLDFLIATGRMKDHEAFADRVQSTKAFLDAIDADQTLLENGEIYALYTKDGEYLDGPGLEKANAYACKDYQWLGEDIDNMEEFHITPQTIFDLQNENAREMYAWVSDLKDNWQETLGLDSWRNVLYFQFKQSE